MNHLITGGTDGIGKAIAIKILRHSQSVEDRVIVNYGHNEEKAKAFLNGLSDEDRSKVILIKADLSSETGLNAFVEAVLDAVPAIDHIVSNIGIGEYAKFDDYTMEMWNRVITTNLTIPTFLIQKLKSHMRNGGSILFVGSYAGVSPYSSSLVYSISKAGVVYLAKALVKEFDSQSVRVNAIAPGFIETAWQSNRSAESYERINKKIALHRFGTPEEVADMAYQVLMNTYMNGTVVEIHGGYNYF